MLELLELLKLLYGKTPDDDEDEDTEEEVTEDDEADESADGDTEADEDTEADSEDDSEDDDSEADGKEADAEKMVPISEVRKVRTEAKKHRLNLRKIEKELKEYKTTIEEKEQQAKRAKMEESERLQVEKSELEDKLAEKAEEAEHYRHALDAEKRNIAVVSIASRLGFADPRDAIAMLGNKIDEFELSDDEIDSQEVEESLTALLEEKPYLRKKDKPKEASKATNQPSVTKVKRQKVRKSENTDPDEEELKRKISERLMASDGRGASKLHSELYRLKRRKEAR